MQKTKPILVVGGYGAVGRYIVQHLHTLLPHSGIVIAGRSRDKAEAAARKFDSRVSAAQVDLTSQNSIATVFPTVSLVILNTEAGSENAARACIDHGISMISVAASVPVMQAIGNLDDMAKAANVALVTEVGLAPGLLNILAREAVTRLPDTRHLDLVVQLGLIGEHGPEAMNWTIARANEVERAVILDPPFPDVGRRVIPVDFVDRDKMRKDLGVETVASFLVILPRWTTTWVQRLAPYLVNRTGLLARLEPGLKALTKLTGMRENEMVLVVRARSGSRRETLRITGENQSRVTGIAAARTAERLMTMPPDGRTGTIGMADIVSLEDIMKDLERIGCSLA
jgi:NAD(P)-dependent dehydrogenase (short-subunit alcohol dehydrogenase family)